MIATAGTTEDPAVLQGRVNTPVPNPHVMRFTTSSDEVAVPSFFGLFPAKSFIVSPCTASPGALAASNSCVGRFKGALAPGIVALAIEDVEELGLLH
jgi:hypothetical protein